MKDFFYEIDLTWQADRTSVLHAHGLPDIEVDLPKEFLLANKKKWTPEHLMASAVSCGFMAYFLDLAEEAKLEVISYTSQSFVKLEQKGNHFKMSEIMLRPCIKLISHLDTPKASLIMEKAKADYYLHDELQLNIEVHPEFDYLNKGERYKA